MRLTLNGKPRDVPDGLTASGLVEHLGFTVGSVVLERNGDVVPRAELANVALEPDDVIEVVRPVQGGSGSLTDALLYLVTDSRMPADTLASVVKAGVGIVQLRDKASEAMAVIRACGPFREVCRAHGVPFVVNDRPDVALAVGADGVHLGQDDLPPEIAREILGSHVLIGRSTHSERQIDAAKSEHERGLADYVAVGPVYETPTKPGRRSTGLALVEYAARHLDCPWFAIGGINEDNIAGVVAAGARRVVVVRAITEASDPAGAAEALVSALRPAR